MIKRLIISFLALCARRAVRRDKPTVVAITGSFGKSSVKEAVATAMGAREPGSDVRCSLKNYNNEFGVPFTVFNVQAPGRDPLKWLKVLWRALWVGRGMGRVGADTLVLEMGADRPGDLSWLIGIARPDVAVVTAAAEAHSEFFGTVEDIAEEKSSLVRSLPKDGLVVLNNDDPRVTAMRRETECETVYFGFSDGSDVQVVHAEPAVTEDERGHAVPAGIRVELAIKGKTYRFTLKGTIGRPQARAAAAALAVAGAFDVPVRQAIERLEKDYHGMAGRTRIIPGIKHTTIIDDSYNAASPLTVISALEDAAGIRLGSGQRRIAALGDMRELGAYTDSAHESVGRAVADAGIDMLVTCGTLARGIAAAARKAGMDAKNIREFDASPEAGLHLQKIIRPGDLILVKGSQGSRMEKIVKELMAEPQEAPFLLVRMSDEWQRIK
jgi:UDP-N-acetylmuramoyl-tripeptide--D-alanyl-D-alanine ligase